MTWYRTPVAQRGVRCTGVGVRRGRQWVLRDVSVELEPGVTGLLGPNGAGKTTLLRVVATAIRPQEGSVRLLGHDPTSEPGMLAARRRLGYMPQEPGFHRRFTVFEFVDYVAILKEHDRRRDRHEAVRHALELVDLQDQAGTRIRQLSGGMRRRVALAAALVGDPELLILDEPTAGLDPDQRLRFREVIGQLGKDRVVLLSTHQTDDVAALCRQVVVLDAGEVRFRGSQAELTSRARGQVWQTSEPVPGARASWRSGDGTYRVLGEQPPDGAAMEPSLEDAYLLLRRDRNGPNR